MENDVKDSTWKDSFQKILLKACWDSPSEKTEAERHSDYPVYYNTYLFPLYQGPNMKIFFKTTESSIYFSNNKYFCLSTIRQMLLKNLREIRENCENIKILNDFFHQSSLTNHYRIIYACLITNQGLLVFKYNLLIKSKSSIEWLA